MLEFREGNPGCTWNNLVDELRMLLELTQPDIVVCPHPLVDIHSDHVFTTVALDRAMHGVQGKRPLLFLYVVHNRGAPSYPFGPAESLVGLPPGGYNGWVADSIYSHPLESDMQQAKYFAVEAMKQEISAFLSGMSRDPTSFLRRAPRPNEIYYVVRGDMLSELIEQKFDIRKTSQTGTEVAK
jgi:hypothetical protein